MCGIVGYVGHRDGVPIILDSLRRLEYRGYDSAGIAVIDVDGVLSGTKSEGKLSRLVERLGSEPLSGTTGLGHTRWATHGRPSDANAHPHADCDEKVAVVHNGIIENYASLREGLLADGHVFRSETDTEVIAHLIEANDEGNLVDAVRQTLKQVRGAYALGVISSGAPRQLVFARSGASPLVVGLGDREMFVASDTPAILKYTRKQVILRENEMVVIDDNGYTLSDFDGKPIERDVTQVMWDASSAEKDGFKHFMLKEMFVQPNVVKETLAGRIDESCHVPLASELKSDESLLRAISKISITGCGTAFHAGMVGMYLLRALCKVPVEMELASEFRYADRALDPSPLTMAMSQSGETADTIEAVKVAKAGGSPVLGICNVLGSHLTRLADGILYTRGGPEIGVAATKTYVSQTVAMVLFALYLARIRHSESVERLREIAEGTKLLPEAIDICLNASDEIRRVARRLRRARTVLFLGRYVNVPTALEGALKLKEISYIHAEGYAAGEMKHGPIALIDENVPVIVLAPHDDLFEKTLGNVEEVMARGGRVVMISDTSGVARLADRLAFGIAVPNCDPFVAPLLYAIPIQLLAYHVAVLKGTDVDQPRNLAKSVTVE